MNYGISVKFVSGLFASAADHENIFKWQLFPFCLNAFSETKYIVKSSKLAYCFYRHSDL